MILISSLHVKLARAALGITQDELAEKSGVSAPTIKKMETINPNDELKSNMSTISALLKFFEKNGVELINEKDSIGVKVGRKIVKQKFK